MNLLSSFTLLSAATVCAILAGCAGGPEPGPPTVVRTAPPLDYEKTITNYLAFRIRGPQKNAEISFGAPEPGACALDGFTSSSRGWVVPVAYATRTGEATGTQSIRINAKQYYFWFLGNTIAGVTPRIELCPGVGSGFESPAPEPAASQGSTAGGPVRATGEGQGREQAERPQDGVTAVSGQPQKATSTTKKSGAAATTARPAVKKKAGSAPAKPKPP